MNMRIIIVYYLEFLFVSSVCSTVQSCSDKLLDDKNKVPDSSFNESSYKDDFRGKWARESSNNEMAWCPKNQISNIKKEYLIIDLGEVYVLKMIMTKGLSRHGYITASSYMIEYKREHDTEWIEYRERGVAKKIKANKDHLTEKYDSLDPSIIARWIKVYPISENYARICLLLQIYGCAYTNNVMEYKMYDGAIKNNLSDYNYDGEISDNFLSNGLGKLMTVLDNKAENTQIPAIDHSIGWSRQTTALNDVTITFRFDMVRNFSSLKIETSNYFIDNIKTFSKIQIHFSLNGHSYQKNQIITVSINEDNTNSEMRFIPVNLRHLIGKFVKIVLSFRSDWIVIRRVEFTSTAATNFPLPKPPPTKDASPVSRRPLHPLSENDIFSIPLAYTLVIVISILIIMLIIGIPCVTIFIRRQKNRTKKCKEALQRHYQEEQARFLTMSQQPFKDSIASTGLFTVNNFNHNLPTINNRMMQESSIYTSLAGSDTESNCASDKQPYLTNNFAVLTSCPIINPAAYNRSNGLSNDYSATSFMNIGSSGASYVPYYSYNAQTARSQVNLRSHYDMNPISACLEMYPNDVSQHNSNSTYSAVQISIQGCVGNSKLLSVVKPADIWLVSSLNQLKSSSTYTKIELDQLNYIGTIGRGCYGSIHIAELTAPQEIQMGSGKKFVCNEYNSLRESLTSSIETENGPNQVQDKQLVSVKVLSKDAPAKIKKEFYQEIKHLMRLNHKNFASILNLEETTIGGCVVVTEYSALQDVFTYLQCFTLSDCRNLSDQHNDVDPKLISQSKLLFIASQVASAMKHMESHQLVHCDLACRNVVVMNEHLLVKISDLAMSQPKFHADYVQIDNCPSSHLCKSTSCLFGNQCNNNNTSCRSASDTVAICLLPIRWMAWQAIIKGVFSTKSDVYSFGVTLWELLTLCQKQPYHELTNEQVMINCNLHARGDSQARVLSLSSNVSKELIDFITHCTLSDETKRPSFIEIDMFLQHKTIGCQTSV